MPEFDRVSDEALMLGVVKALAEAHRRGLTEVSAAGNAPSKPLERADAGPAAGPAQEGMLH
ncbi:hypothetical protein [Alsobacter sp. SYSU BS001988]